MPGISTVDQKFQFFHVYPGFIKPALEVLKKRAPFMTEIQKVIGICFDEIFIDNVVEIDKILDQAVGPAKNANVFFIRAVINNELTYPVFYELDHKLTEKEFMEIIMMLEEIGLKVVASTCDQGCVQSKWIICLDFIIFFKKISFKMTLLKLNSKFCAHVF